jgi:hypothetical protein
MQLFKCFSGFGLFLIQAFSLPAPPPVTQTVSQPSASDKDSMNTLVYKRTHTGDPDESGIFGIHDCMGQVRGWNFGAVIGVGGKSPWHG